MSTLSPKTDADRGERLLAAIEEDVMRDLDPDDEECPHCGGEGYTHECFDGFCEAAEEGCDDCTEECPECRLFRSQVAKAVREAVIEMGDVDVAAAWLKSIGRWDDSMTPERVRAGLERARQPLPRAEE